MTSVMCLALTLGLTAIAFSLISIGFAIRYLGGCIKQFTVTYDINEQVKNKDLILSIGEELAEKANEEEEIKEKENKEKTQKPKSSDVLFLRHLFEHMKGK